MTVSQVLSKELNDLLRSAGFKRKRRSTWYLGGADVIAVFNLQKSNYDQLFFINLGFWIRELSEVADPPHHICHVVMRADALWGENATPLGALLRFEGRDDCDADQIADVKAAMISNVIPFLIRNTKLTELKATVGKEKRLLVRGEAYTILDLTRHGDR